MNSQGSSPLRSILVKIRVAPARGLISLVMHLFNTGISEQTKNALYQQSLPEQWKISDALRRLKMDSAGLSWGVSRPDKYGILFSDLYKGES